MSWFIITWHSYIKYLKSTSQEFNWNAFSLRRIEIILPNVDKCVYNGEVWMALSPALHEHVPHNQGVHCVLYCTCHGTLSP